ncbi:PQQ-binding-like beta-propeller repeat protein [Streptomyces sp. WSLK1-3]|uniref:outer membrane protein assembly factor BamB family protein n=1 Tax=Streptomyces sp. WSLK1-3 TaxID=3375475 RepID=UPI0037A6F28A
MPLHKDGPRSVGGYKPADRLGSGGMGIVHRGRSRSGREVAVTAVSVRSGKQLWQTPTSLEQPGGVTPAPGSRVVHLSSAGARVAALDAARGTPLWETLPRARWVNAESEVLPQVLPNKGALVVTMPSGDVFTLDPAHPERTSVSG